MAGFFFENRVNLVSSRLLRVVHPPACPRAQAKLRVFNAKKKLRRAIITFMACQNFRWLTSPTTAGGLGDISLREYVEEEQSSEEAHTVTDADTASPPTSTFYFPGKRSPDPAGIKAPPGFLPDILSPALGAASCTKERGGVSEGGDERGGIALLSAVTEADISGSSNSNGGNGTGGLPKSKLDGVDDAAETLADLGRPQEGQTRHEVGDVFGREKMTLLF